MADWLTFVSVIMNRIFIILVFVLFAFGMQLSAQNILVLEKPGKRVILFKPGQNIRVYSQAKDTLIKGKIWDISDSSILIRDYEVFLKDIGAIYRERWGFSLLQKVSIIAGVGYLVLNVFNGAISREESAATQTTWIVSGSLIVGGVLLTPLTKRKHKIGEGNWKVKILDFTVD